MKSMSAALAAFLILPTTAHGQDRATAEALDRVLSPWNSTEAPGCAAGVARGDEAPVLRAAGMADLVHGVPNTPQTRFEVGSVSKQFTAAAVLLLAQDGKLKLDDDIRTYLPEMPDYGTPITINHLIDHSSGLRDWGFAMEIAGWPRTTRAFTNDDVLAIMARQTALNHAPGTDYSYNNTGYVLLAIIVERVSGASLDKFSQQRLFKPLGMSATGWRTDFRKIEKGLATAYIEKVDGGHEQRMPFEDVHGDAGLITTVGDLLIWNKALTDGKLGAFVATAFATRPKLADGRTITYTRGLTLPLDTARPEISASGAIGAYRAWLVRYPAERLSVALICNAGEAPGAGVGRGAELGRQITAALLPTPSKPPVSVGRGSPSEAGMFASDKTGLPINFTLDAKGQLSLGGQALTRQSAGRYVLGKDSIHFESAAAVRREKSDGSEERYRRVVPAGTEAVNVDQYVGVYDSPELGARYRVERSGAGLLLRLVERPTVTFDLHRAYGDTWLYDTRFGKGTAVVKFTRMVGNRPDAISIGWVGRVRGVEFARVKD